MNESKKLWLGIGAAILVAFFGVWLALRPVTINVTGNGEASGQRFGGTTGLGSLSLTGDLTVAGATTLTGALTAGAISPTSLVVSGASNLGTLTATALSATSVTVGGGSAITKYVMATSTVNPDEIGAGACTSTSFSLSGSVPQVPAVEIVPYGWASSSVSFTATAGTGEAALAICNYTSTSTVDLASGVAGVGIFTRF